VGSSAHIFGLPEECPARFCRIFAALLLALLSTGCGNGLPGERAIRDAALFPEWMPQAIADLEAQCPPQGGGAQVTLAIEVPADARPGWAAVEAAHGPMEGGEGTVRFSGGLGFRLDGEERVEAIVVDCGRLRAAAKPAEASPSGAVSLPPDLAGTWVQEPVENLSESALRFAEMEGGAVVFVAPSLETGGGESSWEGPFPLSTAEGGGYSIDAEIGSLAEYRTGMIMDQRGRLLVAESNHLLGKGRVGLRLERDGRLIVHGLWIRSEWERWDDEGTPLEGRSTPLETVYRQEVE